MEEFRLLTPEPADGLAKPVIEPPLPATNRELIAAIEGYRYQLDEFAVRTCLNLEKLQQSLQARLDAIASYAAPPRR
jgi:hypothetical protein